MIKIDWKGKIGYGDIISPMCYAFNMAMRNCDDVVLNMHWLHKRGEKFKEEDAETIDHRLKVLWQYVKPAPMHKVYLNQTFGKDIGYNHSNYDDYSPMHNIWFSRLRNLSQGQKPFVALNTTKNHKQQFEEYDPGKSWKDPVGIEKWHIVEKIIQEEWGMDVVHVDYNMKTREALDIYRKCFLAVGYHGSSMWIARYVGAPMLIYSEKTITKSAFPWALVKDNLVESEFAKFNPYALREKGLRRVKELEHQLDIYFNIPNIHRLRGKRT